MTKCKQRNREKIKYFVPVSWQNYSNLSPTHNESLEPTVFLIILPRSKWNNEAPQKNQEIGRVFVVDDSAKQQCHVVQKLLSKYIEQCRKKLIYVYINI